MRCSNSCGFSPAYCQMTEMTGISIFGKISVGVLKSTNGVANSRASAHTMNVYGRRRARRTIHMDLVKCEPRAGRGNQARVRKECVIGGANTRIPAETRLDSFARGAGRACAV